MPSVVETVMGRFFSTRMLAENPPAVAESRRTILATDPVGYAGCCAAIRDMDQTAGLGAVRCPTLVISRNLDVSLPWSGSGAVLAREVPAQPWPTSTRTLVHPNGRDVYGGARRFSCRDAATDEAARVRRQAGRRHVDRATAPRRRSRDFQELIVRYAWGTIWTRPGLAYGTAGS